MGHEVIAPGGVVDVEFLDVKVGDGGAYVGRDEGVDGAVAIVGRNEGVVGVGKVADFFTHGDAVPGQVWHDHILCVKLEKWFVTIHAKETFASADGCCCGFADGAQSFGVKGFGFEPHKVIGLECLCQFDGAAEFEGESHVEGNADVGAKNFAKGSYDGFGTPANLWRGVSCVCGEGWANEMGVGAILQLDEVGFDGGVAAFENFLGKLFKVAGGFDGGYAQALGVAGASSSATVGPVEAQFVAEFAAEKLPDGCAQDFAANVPQGGVDARHGFVGNAAHVTN